MELPQSLGSVYSWGLGDSGALGNGKPQSESVPFKVKLPEKIAQISTGGHFSCVLTQKGQILAFGQTKKSRTGIPEQAEPLFLPKIVPNLNNFVIRQISCGNWHTLALDQNGVILGTGHNAYGQLGDPEEKEFKQFQIIKHSEPIIQISAGDGFSLFINNKQEVLGCGNQALVGIDTEKHVCTLKKLPFNGPVIQISAGFTHSGLISDQNQLFMWGKNDFSQLGLSTGRKHVKVPTLVEHFEKNQIKVAQISCSKGEKYCHSGAIDVDGLTYTWGSGYKGKLGHQEEWSHQDPANEQLPRRIEFIKDVKMKYIRCGGIHTMLLSQEGRVYSFGCGSDGRLGHSESDNYTYLYKEGYPREIQGQFKGKVILDVQCSYYHNICLVLE